MWRLTPRIQHYAWGSREAIAQITGRPFPTDQPEAELWMGAHPAAPSAVPTAAGERALSEFFADDPIDTLGSVVAREFEGRLPFLLKVLAPVQALSIQVHPSLAQVRDAAPGTYADDWPKPEAFYALTDFQVFAGARPFVETAQVCAELGLPELDELLDDAAAEEHPTRALLESLLHLESSAQAALADQVVAACSNSSDPSLAAIVRVAQHHPRDIGLVVLLAMRYQVVPPGGYAFLPAGVLHAYVEGVAIEIMANSDNVVRAGLTAKTIDVDELMRIVDLEPAVTPQHGSVLDGWTEFPAESPYFELRCASVSGALTVPGDGLPRILLAVHGSIEVSDSSDSVRLQPGESCFLSARDTAITVRGDATVFLASPGSIDAQA
ncbi:mannose-6-phosphate isomerase, class I [Demetria terragena]|uniref:mannose-6-phosphate isomerase, class I n=1 Tax=Demetria terragena TaxID=63959 RepID=UPI0003822CA3|nr:mannose-6-phosphate isomerase, class I [Demetria terragena]